MALICYIFILLMVDVLVKEALMEGVLPLIYPLWLFCVSGALE